MISPARIIELAELGIKSFEYFSRDIENFKVFLRKVSPWLKSQQLNSG